MHICYIVLIFVTPFIFSFSSFKSPFFYAEKKRRAVKNGIEIINILNYFLIFCTCCCKILSHRFFGTPKNITK